MVLQMTGMVPANEVQYMVGRDKVAVTSADWNGRVRLEYELSRETKVRIVERFHAFSVLAIVITDGPHRECRGLVRDSYIVRVPDNSRMVFKTGRWGNEVPVFRSRGIYYSARVSMDWDGHYNDQLGNVACMLSVGTSVEFTPFRDWGGEVETGSCSGWIDREVIQ